jgi:hypothetical protein
MDSAKLNARNAYLDPNYICDARHARPLLWTSDHPALKGVKGQTKAEITKVVQTRANNEAALYIRKAFLAHQGWQYIQAPYHFK